MNGIYFCKLFLESTFTFANWNLNLQLTKVHAEEAVLRLPLVQAIVFRIFCHAYYPLCRENKPRTRRTPGRGGFILLNSL